MLLRIILWCDRLYTAKRDVDGRGQLTPEFSPHRFPGPYVLWAPLSRR
ncbi:MAG TPA: hypothetical protein VMU33_11670 [Burkholderiaceae bacterium]|nr:hypothetical protein [Burkholderiaceae bacterium]